MSSDKIIPPKFVNIGGRKITIKVNDEIDEHGLYIHDLRRIEINPKKDEQVATLLHECVHAALTISGLSEVLGANTEEAVCRAIELIAPNIYFKTK
jgi:hypothetical protein